MHSRTDTCLEKRLSTWCAGGACGCCIVTMGCGCIDICRFGQQLLQLHHNKLEVTIDKITAKNKKDKISNTPPYCISEKVPIQKHWCSEHRTLHRCHPNDDILCENLQQPPWTIQSIRPILRVGSKGKPNREYSEPWNSQSLRVHYWSGGGYVWELSQADQELIPDRR